MSALVLLTLLACSGGRNRPPVEGSPDAGGCIDEDEDGLGAGCNAGEDCRDDDPTIGTECPDCEEDPHATGCACDEGAIEACYSGPGATNGVGECVPGTRACAGGTWDPCVGQRLPIDEASRGQNGLDDDCDGLVDDGLCNVLDECAGICCAEGEVCFGAYCAVPDPCAADDECDDDSHCTGGLCLPYEGRETADECEGTGVPAGSSLDGVQQCAWRIDADYSMYTTPIVIDLDETIDGVSQPEILVVAEGPEFDTFFEGQGKVVALDGDDCEERWVSSGPFIATWSPPAAGDVDGDGHVEVASRTPTSDGFDSGWMVLLDDEGDVVCEGTNFPDKTPTPAQIANLDGVGDAEILIGLRAFDSSCDEIWNEPALLMPSGDVPAVADVDLDGALEVVVGDRIFDGATGFLEADFGPELDDGFPAIADFDPVTPEPEIAVVAPSGVRIQTIDGEVIFGPWDVFDSDLVWGGPPVAADVDGDGHPEIGVSGKDSYAVLDPDCEDGWARDGGVCDLGSEGVLWQIDLDGSGGQGSTVFDLDADGWSELLVADSCFLRILDAATGEGLFAIPGAFGSAIPVVADVDGDGAAEIVQVGFTDSFGCPAADPWTGIAYAEGQPGMEVWQEREDRWAAARRIWNQQPYSVTNVEEDGGIPIVPDHNWTTVGRNDFRVNSGAEPGSRPLRVGIDLTVSGRAPDPACPGHVALHAMVANRGLRDAPEGVVVRFYLDAPPELGGVLACETATATLLEPGEIEAVSCNWVDPGVGQRDVWVRVNADRAIPECHVENDDAFVPPVGCEGPG